MSAAEMHSRYRLTLSLSGVVLDLAIVATLSKKAQGSPADAPWDRLPTDLQKEFGSLHIQHLADFDADLLRRDLSAAVTLLPQVAATPARQKVFEWSYYHGALERFWVLHPAQSREALFAASKSRDMKSALGVVFDADGTHPVSAVNPRNNPQRNMVWTPPYRDASGLDETEEWIPLPLQGTQCLRIPELWDRCSPTRS